jgi:hypothetical protein
MYDISFLVRMTGKELINFRSRNTHIIHMSVDGSNSSANDDGDINYCSRQYHRGQYEIMII